MVIMLQKTIPAVYQNTRGRLRGADPRALAQALKELLLKNGFILEIDFIVNDHRHCHQIDTIPGRLFWGNSTVCICQDRNLFVLFVFFICPGSPRMLIPSVSS